MLIRYTCLLALLAVLSLTAAAQTPAMNHLREQLRQARADTARARLTAALSEQMEDHDSTAYYCRLNLAAVARALPETPPARRELLLRYRAHSLNEIGVVFYFAQQADSATGYMEQAWRGWQALNDGPEQLAILSNLFSVYHTANNHRQALATLYRGLHVIETLKPNPGDDPLNTARMAAGFLCDASFYETLQLDFAAGSRYATQALHLLEQVHDTLGLVPVLSALSRAEQGLNHLDRAERYLRRAARLADQRHNADDQALAYDNLGDVLIKRNKLAEARQAYLQLLAQTQGSRWQGSLAIAAKALLNMANVEQRLGHPTAALPYLRRAETAQAASKALYLQRDLAQTQAAVYHDLGQDTKALACYKAYIMARDSASTEATRRAALTQRLTYEGQLKENQLVAARQRAEAETAHQKLLRWLGLGVALLLLALLAMLYRMQRGRQRVAQALEARQLADLQALDQLKTNFFTNISHEFRTPLTLILGPAETLTAHPADPAVREQGGLIRRNARKLLRLTTQLLDLSKLEAGALRLLPAAADAAQATRQAVGNFASLAEANGVALTLEGAATALPLVFDPAKLEEMLDNLLANALRLTPAGGRVQVAVAATAPTPDQPAGGVAWTVADTGPGIAPENLLRLFERFYQVPEGGEAHAGTGLGLALVRELAALHGGTATVDSAPGRGTTFRIWLPQGLVPVGGPDAERIIDNQSIKAIEMTDKLADATELPGFVLADNAPADDAPLVLLVEDNADVRAFVRATLAPAGYRLLEAPGGESGLALARAEVPDLIVSDVMMPGLTGYQLCAALKTDVATSHIPVVLLTARASADDKLEGLETGADAYLAKPFNPRELQAQVRNLLALRERVRERFGWAVAAPAADGLEASEVAEAIKIAGPAADFTAESPVPANPLNDPAALAALPALDRQFLEKVNALLAAHLGDEGFGVDQMSEALNLSRTQVHRKLKALTGQTPGECLRLTRMHCALTLLRARAGTVADIAFRVGYGSPAHFSTAFSRQFGFLPSLAHKQEE